LEGGLVQYALELPVDIAEEFIQAKKKRVVGSLNGHPYKRAIQGRKNGRPILILGKRYLKEAGLREGMIVDTIMKADPNPDQIDLPEEFLIVLEQDPAAKKKWDAMTVGARRSYSIYLNSAKREETRIKRSLQLAEKMKTGRLYSDRK
jgi:hypothetical protein